MINITIYILGEKFNLSMEDEFFEYVREDLQKLQDITTPKEVLSFFLDKSKKEFENEKILKKIVKKLEKY